MHVSHAISTFFARNFATVRNKCSDYFGSGCKAWTAGHEVVSMQGSHRERRNRLFKKVTATTPKSLLFSLRILLEVLVAEQINATVSPIQTNAGWSRPITSVRSIHL